MATGSIANVMPTSGSNTYGYYIKFPDGTLIMYGTASTTTSGYAAVTFPVAITSTSSATFQATPRYSTGSTALDFIGVTSFSGTSGGTIYFRKTDGATSITSNASVFWCVIGKWK